MNKKERLLLWGCAGLSLLIGIISLCIAAYRTPDLGFDYMGILVGILSLLVTVLLAWNIYAVFDIKSEKKEIENIKLDSFIKSQTNISLTYHALGDFYYSMMGHKEPLGLDYQFLFARLWEINHWSQIGKYPLCNELINTILTIYNKPEDTHMLKSCRDRLLLIVNGFQSQEKLEHIEELVSTISRFAV